jgi:processive 1,2-diacylglycerol beta-glucosyltransferase
MERNMKVLFLTSSPGYGHVRAAEAIEAELRHRHPDLQAQHLDVWHIIDEHVRAAVQDGYLRMTAEYPHLYQQLYDLDEGFYRQLAGRTEPDEEIVRFLTEHQRRWYPESAWGLRALVKYKSLDGALLHTVINGICARRSNPADRLVLAGALRLIYRILERRLKDWVRECEPDLIVATQMYPNALLSGAVQRGQIRQPIIGVITDYGLQGVWVRPSTSCYCVGDIDVAHALLCLGVQDSRIEVTGIPLMPSFRQPPSQALARQRLGLEERPTLLITGGRHAIGTVEAVQHILADPATDCHVLVTAGPSTEGYGILQDLACRFPRLKLYGWTDDMVTLFSAADVVAGKPGGLSITEALACGRPFFATCSLGGQEAHNVKYLERLGLGERIDPARLPQKVRSIFESPARLLGMQLHARQQLRRRSAAAVADVVERTLRSPAERTAVQAFRK